MSDKYADVALAIMNGYGMCEYDYEERDRIMAMLHEAFPPVLVDTDIEKLVRDIYATITFGECDRVDEDVAEATQLIQGYVDAQRKTGECALCITKESVCRTCMRNPNSINIDHYTKE